MRAFRSAASVTIGFLCFAAAASRAEAKECTNPLVNTCINADTLWPNPGPLRFTGVSGTETLGEGQVGFGLLGTYQSQPVLLHVASPGGDGSDQAVIDHQVNGNFLFAYGATDKLQLDFAMPITFAQTGAGTSSLTGGRVLRDTAVRDIRFGFAYALVPRVRIDPMQASNEGGAGKSWSLAARFHVSAPTGDNTDFGGEKTAVFVPDVATDYRLGSLFFGASLGMRIRPVSEFAGARVGTQLTTAAGVGFDILPKELLAIMLEGRAYVNFADQHKTSQSAFGISSEPKTQDTTIIPAEWLLGVRSAPVLGGDVSFHAGGGGPIPLGPDAITVPRYRFVLGAIYAPTVRDSDGDGIADKVDFCPNEKGVRGGERPGCPRVEAPAP
jgi:OOP family OmpA-OmpF porin